MKKEPLVYLIDILDAIEKIELYVGTITWEEFEKDTQIQDAVIRRFLVIGEAANRLEDDFRSTYNQIPWVEMADFRNVLVHGYDEIELGMLWKVIKDGDLAKAKGQIGELFDKLGGSSLSTSV